MGKLSYIEEFDKISKELYGFSYESVNITKLQQLRVRNTLEKTNPKVFEEYLKS
jgi:hypothetical protein